MGGCRGQIFTIVREVCDLAPLSLILSSILNGTIIYASDPLSNIVGVRPPSCVRIGFQMCGHICRGVNSFWFNFYVSAELILHALCEMAFSEQQDLRRISFLNVSCIPVDRVLHILVAALVCAFGSCEGLEFFDLLCSKALSYDPEIMENGAIYRIHKVPNVDVFLILGLRYLSPNGSVDGRLQEENQPIRQDAIRQLRVRFK